MSAQRKRNVRSATPPSGHGVPRGALGRDRNRGQRSSSSGWPPRPDAGERRRPPPGRPTRRRTPRRAAMAGALRRTNTIVTSWSTLRTVLAQSVPDCAHVDVDASSTYVEQGTIAREDRIALAVSRLTPQGDQ